MELETEQMLDRMLELAKTERAHFKYSGDEKFGPTAVVVGSDSSIESFPLNFRDEDEKQKMGRSIATIALGRRAFAVVLISDTRWINSDRLTEHFRMKPVAEIGIEQFRRDYHKILAAHGGQIKNFPRSVWNEAVVVAVKGPTIDTAIRMANYIEGPDDTVEYAYVEDQTPPFGGELELIPDWWVKR
jgi:hypothetical protein